MSAPIWTFVVLASADLEHAARQAIICKLLCGGEVMPGDGYFLQATVMNQRPARDDARSRGDLRAHRGRLSRRLHRRGRCDGQRHRPRPLLPTSSVKTSARALDVADSRAE